MKETIRNKQQMLILLENELKQWEELIADLSEDKIITAPLANAWTVKDLFAHLMAWDQLVIARLDAAKFDREPIMPEWVIETPLDLDETLKLKQLNAKIHSLYRELSWEQVYQSWKANFLKILTLGKEISEADLLVTGRYPWLKGYSLMANLQGTYEHHHEEHFESFLTWIRQ